MRRVVVLLVLIPVIAAAAGAQSRQTEPKPGMSMMDCPMNLQGTSVTAVDTPSGVTVSITTKPENVSDLRGRVEQMAAMHSTDHPSQAMVQGQMMSGTVKYEAIEKGARLTLTPKDPTKLAEFRREIRAHVENMQKGECSMMKDMMQGMMQGIKDGTLKPEVKPESEKSEIDHSAHHPEDKK